MERHDEMEQNTSPATRRLMRASRLSWRLAAVAGVAVVVGAGVLGGGITGAFGATRSAQSVAVSSVVQRSTLAGCTAASSTVRASDQDGSSVAGTTTNQTAVSVWVPPIVDIVVNSAGTPIAVTTNTGHAPSCNDMFMVFSTSSLTRGRIAHLNQINAVMEHDLSGTWTVGVLRLLA
jgi:hypothetical protein